MDANKQLNDMFDLGDASGGGGSGNLDLEMAGDSTFDDMMWGEGDGDASMADLDDAFFDMK